MTGRRREGLAPSLFPFLAVLICTLGTLILMLAIFARDGSNARAASVELAQTQDSDIRTRQMREADAELDRRLSEVQWQRNQVVRTRDEQTSDIDERRLRQAHLEDHVRRLREELARIESEVRATQDKSQTVKSSQATVDALKSKIETEKLKIEKLSGEQQLKAPRIVIVPHKGPNGTDRRPVYVECRENGVYLQPGNVAIDPKYLDNDIPGPNPLDAALRTIRGYAMKNYGDVDAPYPLLVIRPAGIPTYGAARQAMKGWDDQYGYELVPDDVDLAYPEPDNLLNQQVEDAIAQAVREQQAIARSGLRQGGSGMLHGGIRYGGDVSQPTGPAGEASQAATTTQGGMAPGEANGGTAQAGTAQAGTAQAGTAQGGLGKAGVGQLAAGRTPRRASDLPILSARNMDAAAQDALQNGFRGSSGANRARQTEVAAKRGAVAAEKTTANDQLSAAEEVRIASSQPGGQLGNGQARGSVNGTQATDASAPSYTSVNSQGPSGSNQPNPGDSQLADSRTAGNPDPFAPPSDVAGTSHRRSATTDPDAPIGGTQSTGSANSSNPAGTAPQPLDNASAAINQSSDSSLQPPPPNVKIDVNGQSPPKSLVKRAGRNWALPPQAAATVGTSMVRVIRAECHEDRLVLLPEGGRGAINIYGFSDGDIDRASLEMATAIRDRVDRWGAAMPGGRWHPLLEVNVMPGGDVRYRQMQRLMDGSGVEMAVKGAPR